ncbi:hypothetical protein ANN_27596 [Periplaneta americana]|uniref:Uncharacterized protein n=1 Tax=Periplaneta americana TaxID=6978 RepID=A0ABQ8RWN9_PERAM|nr:hypothetical protein ANN_27596 [Periplaneta americana]
MFKRDTHLFLIRGHAFLSNDQDFFLIAKKKRTVFVQTPNQWDDIIASCRVHPKPFEVKRVHTPDFLNIMKTTMEPYFAQSCRCQLKLKQLRMYKVNRDSPHVGVRNSYSGPWRSVHIHKRVSVPQELMFATLYNEPLKIKQ